MDALHGETEVAYFKAMRTFFETIIAKRIFDREAV